MEIKHRGRTKKPINDVFKMLLDMKLVPDESSESPQEIATRLSAEYATTTEMYQKLFDINTLVLDEYEAELSDMQNLVTLMSS